jgi:hypothetical protein
LPPSPQVKISNDKETDALRRTLPTLIDEDARKTAAPDVSVGASSSFSLA